MFRAVSFRAGRRDKIVEKSLYDTDLYAWSNQQAELLRAGKLSALDVENLVEELESMGKQERRELVHRLEVLLLHLLKWQYQSNLRSNSWKYSIIVQRKDITKHLNHNPSLKPFVSEAIDEAYDTARLTAAGETGLPESTFPGNSPYSSEEIMSSEFWPPA